MKQKDMVIKVTGSNLGEVHFTVKGPTETMFEGGVYHGKIILPANFPFGAPDVQLISPSGRFTPHKAICINGYTAWHKESWSPAVTISSIVRAVQSLFSELSQTGIGYDFTPDQSEVKRLLPQSKVFVCPECGLKHTDCFKDEEKTPEKA